MVTWIILMIISVAIENIIFKLDDENYINTKQSLIFTILNIVLFLLIIWSVYFSK